MSNTDQEQRSASRAGLYQEITDKIIRQIEAGTIPRVQLWTSNTSLSIPRNASTQRAYSGINIVLLWDALFSRQYEVNQWLTFNQSVRRASRMKGVTDGSMSSVQLCRHLPHALPVTVLCEAGMKAQVAFQPSEQIGHGEGRMVNCVNPR